MSDPAIAMSTESEEQGFADAVAAFAKDDVAVPEPVLPPPQVPPPPTDETEKVPEKVASEEEPIYKDKDEKPEEKTPPQEFEEEYVEFQGKQKERFNSVYGTMRRFERENLTLQQQLQRLQQQLQTPVPPVQQPTQPVQPTSFLEPEPKLEQFETADQWGARLSEWTARKVKAEVLAEIQSYNLTREQQEAKQRNIDYINSRIVEGHKQFGVREFNQASKEVIEFAPAGSSMYNLLINSEKFPEVVTHLAKNLPEADRISSLDYDNQVYELKSLERKLALAAKSKSNNNKQATKVEAPGVGEEPGKPTVSITKLRNAARASGSVKDWASVFQADPTM